MYVPVINAAAMPVINQPIQKKIVLVIKGNGVDRQYQYSLLDLQKMKSFYVEASYSSVNNMPKQKFFAGKGVRLLDLLRADGMKDTASTVTVRATDGYTRVFKMQKLKEKRLFFPNIMNGYSKQGAQDVPVIVAWSHCENSYAISECTAGAIRLMIGQLRPDEITAQDFVKYVYEIEVSK